MNERPKSDTVSKYYVSFEEGEVMEGGCLIGSHGNGSTIDEAIKDYCRQVETKRMAFGAYTDNIEFPDQSWLRNDRLNYTTDPIKAERFLTKKEALLFIKHYRLDEFGAEATEHEFVE